MERVERESLPAGETNPEEYRVQVRSKKQVIEQVNRYKNILKTVLDGQPEVEAETKRVLLQELLAVGRTHFRHLCYSLHVNIDNPLKTPHTLFL